MSEGAITKQSAFVGLHAYQGQRMLVDHLVRNGAPFEQVEGLGREQLTLLLHCDQPPEPLRHVHHRRIELYIKHLSHATPYELTKLQDADEAKLIKALDRVRRERLDVCPRREVRLPKAGIHV